MTAEQARELSESKKKSLEDILNSVRIMATDGYTDTVFDLRHIENKEEMTSALEALGYKVTIFSDYFRVSWK